MLQGQVRVVDWGSATVRNYFGQVEVDLTRIVAKNHTSTVDNEGMGRVLVVHPASFDRGTDRQTPFGRGTYRRERLVRRELGDHHADLLMQLAPGWQLGKSLQNDPIVCRLVQPERHHSRLRQTFVSD